MAGACSTDLRERVLLAMEGGATPEAVARRFAVGRSTAYRWLEGARTVEDLHQAFGPALDAITAQDARGFFRHAGYACPN